jgi:hypothetical protein
METAAAVTGEDQLRDHSRHRARNDNNADLHRIPSQLLGAWRMNEIVSLFLKSAAEQSPILLTYFVAIFVAVIFWERAPRPSGLVLIAILVLLVTSFGQMFVFAWLMSRTAKSFDALGVARLIWMESAIAFFVSIIRAVGMAILLAAVWVGRQAKTA